MGAGTRSSPHAAGLEALGIEGPARDRLASYLETLARWSARVNLTGARTPEERVRLLVGDVLGIAELPAAGQLIDIGSGNGSPGLVLALLREDLQVTLLEPRAHRWAFLREAARAARVSSRVEALRLRHDQYQGRPAPTVVLRALALRLAEIDPLVAPGGRILFLGGSPREDPPYRLLERRSSVPGDAWVFGRA